MLTPQQMLETARAAATPELRNMANQVFRLMPSGDQRELLFLRMMEQEQKIASLESRMRQAVTHVEPD